MRKTIDTNILVRALVDEGTERSRLAAECLTTDLVHIPATVMLEAEWILRTRFRASRDEISQHFGMLLGMSNIVFDSREIVSNSVEAHGAGLDFADALHLFGAGESDVFVTFDKALRRTASDKLTAVPVISPDMISNPSASGSTEKEKRQ